MSTNRNGSHEICPPQANGWFVGPSETTHSFRGGRDGEMGVWANFGSPPGSSWLEHNGDRPAGLSLAPSVLRAGQCLLVNSRVRKYIPPIGSRAPYPPQRGALVVPILDQTSYLDDPGTVSNIREGKTSTNKSQGNIGRTGLLVYLLLHPLILRLSPAQKASPQHSFPTSNHQLPSLPDNTRGPLPVTTSTLLPPCHNGPSNQLREQLLL